MMKLSIIYLGGWHQCLANTCMVAMRKFFYIKPQLLGDHAPPKTQCPEGRPWLLQTQSESIHDLQVESLQKRYLIPRHNKKFAHHQAEYQISLVPRLLCHAREPGNEAKYQIRHVIVKGWCAPGKCSNIFEKKKILALHAKANILIMNSNSFWNIKSTLLHVEYSWSSANLFEILYFFDGILHCCFLFVCLLEGSIYFFVVNMGNSSSA